MDLMIGQIMLTALDFAPAGTVACNGQSLPSSTYGALYEVVGNAYGGDATSFGVPALAPLATQSGAALNWVIATGGVPWGSGMEAVIGEIRLLPATPPANGTLAQSWLPCDGRVIPIVQNEPLYALTGTLFGGDGVHNFALPSIKPQAVPNGPALAAWICTEGGFPPIGGDSFTPAVGQSVWESYLGAVLQLPYVNANDLDGLGVCLGQTLPIANWSTLFSLLATRYGGNGTTSFLLPNRPADNNVSYEIVVSGYYPPRP